MPVVERTRPEEALAARRSLQAQIARLEGELARIMACTYPPVAVTAGEPAPGRRGPRLLDLGALERTRDDLAGRVSTADRLRAEQTSRQAEARALLHDMLAEPGKYRGAVVTNSDLGLPGCTTYRVVPRLFSSWWRVKISSGCPLPSRRGDPHVSRHNRKRRPRPGGSKSTAPQVPPRAPKPQRPRIEDRPKPPWHPVPLVEIAVLVGIVCIAVGFFSKDTSRGRTLLALGFILGSLGGLDTAIREHFAGYRRHTLLLALAPAVAATILLAVAGAPAVLIPLVAVAVFGAAFMLLRGAWTRAQAPPQRQ